MFIGEPRLTWPKTLTSGDRHGGFVRYHAAHVQKPHMELRVFVFSPQHAFKGCEVDTCAFALRGLGLGFWLAGYAAERVDNFE